jgi:hypothetical protein
MPSQQLWAATQSLQGRWQVWLPARILAVMLRTVSYAPGSLHVK